MGEEFEFEAFDFESKNAWETGGVRRAAGVKEVIGGGGSGDGGNVVRAKKAPRRRKTECVELTVEHEMRMAFGEVRLLEAMRYERPREGVSYHFITWGDADSLSFLKVCLNWYRLDWLLVSTWCMGGRRYTAITRMVGEWLRWADRRVCRRDISRKLQERVGDVRKILR